jgi:hypothetical protein
VSELRSATKGDTKVVALLIERDGSQIFLPIRTG